MHFERPSADILAASLGDGGTGRSGQTINARPRTRVRRGSYRPFRTRCKFRLRNTATTVLQSCPVIRSINARVRALIFRFCCRAARTTFRTISLSLVRSRAQPSSALKATTRRTRGYPPENALDDRPLVSPDLVYLAPCSAVLTEVLKDCVDGQVLRRP